MIRPAQPVDVPSIVALVKQLADYERAPDEAKMTEPALEAALFGDSPKLFGHVAEIDGEVVGMALWFLNFSSWLGKHGVYLEDLYVQPAHRGSGLGKALLEELARIAVENDYGRVEWSVLDWNQSAIDFYRRAGAIGMDEWTVFRLTGDALRDFAKGNS